MQGENKMKYFLLLLAMMILLVPTYTWAKGGSYTRKAPIPVVASIAGPPLILVRDIQRQSSGDCGSVCHSRSFRRAKASFQ
jgi:hypothetical protein